MANVTIKELAKIQVLADGPVSFKNIYNYCKQEFNGQVLDYNVAAALNELIKEGVIVLYDDGISFYPA